MINNLIAGLDLLLAVVLIVGIISFYKYLRYRHLKNKMIINNTETIEVRNWNWRKVLVSINILKKKQKIYFWISMVCLILVVVAMIGFGINEFN